MSWKCPSCGRQNYETLNNCICGYSSDGGVLIKEELKDYRGVSEDTAQCLDTFLDYTKDQTPLHGPLESHDSEVTAGPDSRSSMPDEEVIKEIDSWLFIFSPADSCISIGTPALQPFRLKISLEDLEDLLEIVYQKTGNEKTTRKLSLAVTDIIGVIDKVDRFIKEKKSKVSIKFTTEELQEVTDFINLQLRERRRAFEARVRLSIKVYLTYNGKLHEFHTRNISEGGLYIKTKEPFPVGAEVGIRLLLEPVRDIRAKGVVVHIQRPRDETPEHPSGIGIAFKEIKNYQQWALRDFIKKSHNRIGQTGPLPFL